MPSKNSAPKRKNDPKAGKVTKMIVDEVRREAARKKDRPPTPEEIARERIRDCARNIVHKVDEVLDIEKLNACVGLIQDAGAAL